LNDFNYYHVDPATTRGDATGRYPHNYVKFPWFLKPVEWWASMSRALTGRTAYLLKDSLLKAFDSVDAPAGRWGTAEELGVLRQCIEIASRNFDGNPYISPIGRVVIKIMVSEPIKNRAETIKFYEANRDFIESNGRYQAPVLVVGAARTGTTLLHRLLSEDPNTRSPYDYELVYCTPPLRTGMDPLRDPRVKRRLSDLAMGAKIVPGYAEKIAESHPFGATEKEESLSMVAIHNGLFFLFSLAAGREYVRSLAQPGMGDALLRYERNLFTMLDAYCPAKSHWTQKSPVYAYRFGDIFTHYPDARVIVTHRDPVNNLASGCRLFETFSLPFDVEGSLDKLRFGSLVQELWSASWSVPLEFRRANPQYEPQIIDCMYPDLVRDPIGMVKNIYRKFGLDYTQEFEDRMKLALANNPQGKRGRHQYTSQEYGIDPDSLYEQNRAYFDHYGFKPVLPQ